MKNYFVFGFLCLTVTALSADIGETWKRTTCTLDNAGDSCTRWDGQPGVCKVQPCATMSNPNQQCGVCAPSD